MNQNQKPFAFKLAEEKQTAEKSTKWQARDGVAVAGCTIAFRTGEYDAWENKFRRDDGIPC
jgi:hypothetical protein